MNKKIVKLILSLALLALIVVLAYFSFRSVPSAPVSLGDDKLKVVASFYPLYFFAAEIGGDQAFVRNITPAGAESHDYEPTAADMAAIEDSRLLILNGGGLEAWADGLGTDSDWESDKTIIAGDALATKEMEEDGERRKDPHVWLSPILAFQMADRIAAGFVSADSENADYYLANAADLKQRLQDLDAAYRQSLSACARQDFITSHAAFAYLADAYGLRQVPIAGLSPETEPSPREMADIVKFARENEVRYIFFESLASPKLAQAIASEIGAQTLVLNPLEGLLPAEVAAGQDYFSVMLDNLSNLLIALQCQP